MTQQTLIAVDPDALAGIQAEMERLHKRLDAVQMQSAPKWITVDQLAKKVGRSKRTVMRKVEAGTLDSKMVSGVLMVLNPDV